MSLLSLLHLGASVIAFGVAIAIFQLRKGDPRHRLLGWIYTVAMVVSIGGITIRTASQLRPFAIYGIGVLIALGFAVWIARNRRMGPTRIAWHSGLMVATFLGTAMAIGSIVGGMAVGAANGAKFYVVFNLVIATFTVVALMIIHRRAVMWSALSGESLRATRLKLYGLILSTSMLLIIAQWPLATASA